MLSLDTLRGFFYKQLIGEAIILYRPALLLRYSTVQCLHLPQRRDTESVSLIHDVIASRGPRNLHVYCKCFVDAASVAFNGSSSLSSGFSGWIGCLLLHNGSASLSESGLDHTTLPFTNSASLSITGSTGFPLLLYNLIIVAYAFHLFSIAIPIRSNIIQFLEHCVALITI